MLTISMKFSFKNLKKNLDKINLSLLFKLTSSDLMVYGIATLEGSGLTQLMN